MSNIVKERSIKNHTYYFFDDIINIKDFDANNIKKYSYLLCCIQDDQRFKLSCVNLLYLTFNNMNGYFEEINESKYLTLVPTNETKEKIKK